MAGRGVNKVILVGNIGQDPETRYLPSGGAVTNATLATSESWKDKNTGENQERTEWHRIVFYNKLAEIVAEYVKKGSKLYVEGSLRTRSWEQDGVKRCSVTALRDARRSPAMSSPSSTISVADQVNVGAMRQRRGATASSSSPVQVNVAPVGPTGGEMPQAGAGEGHASTASATPTTVQDSRLETNDRMPHPAMTGPRAGVTHTARATRPRLPSSRCTAAPHRGSSRGYRFRRCT